MKTWHSTSTGRVWHRTYKAKRREQWRLAGRCTECGQAPKAPWLKCELCLIGTTIRVERSVYKKRMAKAELRKKIA